MIKSLNYKKSINYMVFAAIWSLLAMVVFAYNVLPTQGAEGNFSEEQLRAALTDLSAAAGQTFTTHDEAEAFCDLEKNFSICAEVGKKNNLYTQEEVKQVDIFVNEIKGKIAEDLKNCQTTECLLNVANELSQKLAAKNSTVAGQLDLTTKLVQQKQGVITAAKEAGVKFDDCRQMNPDTASVDLLRACAKLAKDSRVQQYIPEGARDTFGYNDKMVDFREALAKNEYQCGDNTLEGCGNYCLNPSTEARAGGATTIPQVCRQIAVRFFGPEGVKELEAAYQQVGKAREFYYKKAENFVFTTIEGQNLNSLEAIGQYLEQSMNKGCVECVEKGMDFMQSQGFVQPSEAEFAKKMVKKIKDKGGIPNFDTCAQDPQACREFIPDEQQDDFEEFGQLEDIMKNELGFDPSQCQRGEFDPSIGERCLIGSKKALEKIGSLNFKSPNVRAVVEDIKRKVSNGEEFLKKKDNFRQVFQGQGGPGGCRSEQECRAYCSDSSHGPECIAFGTQQGIFRKDEAVERFQQFNQTLQVPQQQNYEQAFPGQGPYPGFQPPGQFYQPPPGQIPGFTQPGPYPYPYPPPGPGPSPECFQALQSGDFAKAKTACTVYTPPPISKPFCPLSPAFECPSGTFRKSRVDSQGCEYSECVSTGEVTPIGQYCAPPAYWDPYSRRCESGYSVPPYPTGGGQCPGFAHDMGGYCMLNSDTSRCAVYSLATSESNYTPSACQSARPSYSYTPYPGDANACPGFAYSRWDNQGKRYCQLNNKRACDYNYPSYLTEGSNYSESNCPAEPSYSYSPYPTGGGQCPNFSHDMGGYCMLNSDTSRCAVYSLATSESNYTPSACQSARPSYSYTPYPPCPAGQWWDPAIKACKVTTPSDTPTSSSCPSGAHNMGSYCMSDSQSDKCGPLNSSSTSSFGSCSSYQTSYTPYPSCPAGQWWDGSSSSCKPNDYGGGCTGTTQSTCTAQTNCRWYQGTNESGADRSYCYYSSGSSYTPYPTYTPYSSSCPSGAHNMGSYCMSDSQSDKCGPLNSSSTGSFGSCSAYQTSYSPYPSYSNYPTYTPYSSSCPAGSHNMGSYCMSDTNSSQCGPLNSSSTGSFGSCSAYQTSYTPYPTATTYQSYTPYPTTTYQSYTPYPTTDPSASCTQAGGTWSGSACQYPTVAATPYPTTDPSAACTQYGGTWNGSYCVYPTPTPATSPSAFNPQHHNAVAHTTAIRSSVHQLAVTNTIMTCADSGRRWDEDDSACRVTAKYFFASILKPLISFFK